MADEQLRQEIDAYVDEVWEEFIADVERLVAIDSTADPDTAREGAPWGEGPARALECALDIAGRIGLEPHNMEGYVGYADLPGESDKQIATIGHVDVVPVGTGWRNDPFKLVREDGCLVARGVEDDKGPTMTAMYAFRFFRDRGERLPYTLRCILGANEETGMGDVDYYLARQPEPDFLFTPDACFPLVYGEKGTFFGEITSAAGAVGSKLRSLEGGTVSNAVPDAARAVVQADASSLPEAHGISVRDLGDGCCEVSASGRSAHASKPEVGESAIATLVSYLLDHDLCSEGERPFLEMERALLSATDGSGAGISCSDEELGPLTIVGGTLRQDGDRLVQSVDCRFPTTTDAEEISAALSRLAAGCQATFELGSTMAPFVIDPQSAPVQALVSAYNDVTGLDGKPFTMGGATYARRFAHGVGFGPGRQGLKKPDWVNSEHSPNEGIMEEALRRAMKAYILGIARLMRLEF